MPKNPLAIIILAAGKGTRMNNPNQPKVMADLCGKPVIDHVLRYALDLEPTTVVLVVGHLHELVREYVDIHFSEHVEYAVQSEQLGTGHAVMQAAPLLQDFAGDVLILYGDMPLLNSATLRNVIVQHEQTGATLSVVSANHPNPTGYGRIVRGADGKFERIVEEKDATDTERAITEVNGGAYIVNARLLFKALHSISNKNVQGEYHITDVVEILSAQDQSIEAIQIDSHLKLLGVNTFEELAAAQKILEQ